MARRELGPAALRVAQAVAAALPGEPFVVGCSGGADSLALALGARWAASMAGVDFVAVVVDHGLQSGSEVVARGVADVLAECGIAAEVRRVDVAGGGSVEASARDARLGALASGGRPVLLGHTLDDQAESVLLGLARGSGVRSLAGMAPRRGLFVRPLLGLRRATTEQACAEWGVRPWADPHNADERFARVRVRRSVLPVLEAELGPGIAEALARTAALARADADAFDSATPRHEGDPRVAWLVGLDPAVRSRALRAWLLENGVETTSGQLASVGALVTDWRGQKGVDVRGGRVVRVDGLLRWRPARPLDESV